MNPYPPHACSGERTVIEIYEDDLGDVMMLREAMGRDGEWRLVGQTPAVRHSAKSRCHECGETFLETVVVPVAVIEKPKAGGDAGAP